MFKEKRTHNKFAWKNMGDLEKGRPNLGLKVPVLAYRLLQYTWRDVMITELCVDKANDIIIKAGRLAGAQFCANLLNRELDFNEFVSQLQRVLREQSIGILRIEKVDLENMRFTLTIAEIMIWYAIALNIREKILKKIIWITAAQRFLKELYSKRRPDNVTVFRKILKDADVWLMSARW